MKIKFEFEVGSFLKAAEVEEVLKKHNIKYSATIDTNGKSSSSTGIRRKRITKIELAAVVQCIQKNRDWDDKTVAKSAGVSQSTVSRIRAGTHSLQQG